MLQKQSFIQTPRAPRNTKGCYMSNDRYFQCGSEFLCFDSPKFPKGMSYLKKSHCLTKNFPFFHWFYLRLSQKCLFSTFLCRNGHGNMTSHVTLAYQLIFLSFLKWKISTFNFEEIPMKKLKKFCQTIRFLEK